jgi:hypothetical protein
LAREAAHRKSVNSPDRPADLNVYRLLFGFRVPCDHSVRFANGTRFIAGSL